MDSASQLDLFGPAPRASQHLLPESAEGQTTTGGSGRRLWSLYGRFVPGGSCLKTSWAWLLLTVDWRSTESALTWNVQGIPSSRLLFRLVLSAHPTGASGCSSWPTPLVPTGGRSNPAFTTQTGQRPDGKKATVDIQQIAKDVKPWGTPRAFDSFGIVRGDKAKMKARGDGTKGNFSEQASNVKPWATPRANSIYAELLLSRRKRPGQERFPAMPDQALDTSTAGLPFLTFTGTGDESPETWRLSPAFVEATMGFPPGWTDIE